MTLRHGSGGRRNTLRLSGSVWGLPHAAGRSGGTARPTIEVDVNIRVGKANRDHFSVLRTLELASFETLRAAGAVIGEATASSDEELQQYLNADLLFAAFDEQAMPVGYGGGYTEESWLHIAELDVHPNFQRKGIGRQIANALLNEGRARNLKGATLTTDRFAPFNATFYISLGFRPIPNDALPERLRAALRTEKEKGLDPRRRVAMMLMF
ncbi:GNAT family N-acetyltransferase [Azospirillum sp. ST 5-10]|uniref:GNAT family N-acetyltransferase n=1 Tax=unclassified Azospirillum TaxID=2630922 RepID=UPI003F4A2429